MATTLVPGTSTPKPTTSASAPPRRGSRGKGYGASKNHLRADIPVRVRSGWEANVYRLLRWLRGGNYPRDQIFQSLFGYYGILVDFDYEQYTYFFPGSKTTGNARYLSDFELSILTLADPKSAPSGRNPGVLATWIVEVKGRLAQGGRLMEVDLTQLDERSDTDSRIKLERLRRYYPKRAKRTLLLGEREYKALDTIYKSVIPYWE